MHPEVVEHEETSVAGPHPRRMRDALARAKKGDHQARTEVANYCWERYKHRIQRFYSADPAVSMDDLMVTFWEGIYGHVPLADGRGCDFYHIGQRGVWAVQSEVRQIKSQMRQRQAIDWKKMVGGMEDSPLNGIENVQDPTAEFADVLVSRLYADERVKVLTNASLKPRSREALDLMLSGELGDPTEDGFNQRLAQALGVSPQRASQLVKSIRESVTL